MAPTSHQAELHIGHPGEARGEIAADGSGSIDADPHGLPPVRYNEDVVPAR